MKPPPDRLSLRVIVSYETVRCWCRKFGQSFADSLRRRRPRPGDKWYLDEVFIRIQGVQHYLWRAVDQSGVVLDIPVQDRRNAKAAKRFIKRLLKGVQNAPRVIITDKLRSYGVAQRHLLPDVEHRQKPLPQQSRGEFTPTDATARTADAAVQIPRPAFIHGHFHPWRHLMAATAYRSFRSEAFNVWPQETCVHHTV